MCNAVSAVRCAICNVQHAMLNVQFAMIKVQCALCNDQCTMCSVRCSVNYAAASFCDKEPGADQRTGCPSSLPSPTILPWDNPKKQTQIGFSPKVLAEKNKNRRPPLNGYCTQNRRHTQAKACRSMKFDLLFCEKLSAAAIQLLLQSLSREHSAPPSDMWSEGHHTFAKPGFKR